MAEPSEANSESARVRLLELLEGDDWKFSLRAETEGKLALRWLHDRVPTRGEMVAYVVALLKANLELMCVPQGTPPGSTGIAWQMVDSRNIFVKLRIEGGFGQASQVEYAYIQSLHESAHPK
jgi:hypothetical protein